MKITPRSIIIAGIIIVGISGPVLIVLASILSRSLGDLIGGFAVMGVIVIVLAAIGVMLFTKFSAAKLKLDSRRYEHIETMARAGFLPAGNRYISTRVMQIEAPAQTHVAPPDPKSGVHFTDSEIRTNVVNLLLFSVQLLGRESKRIASNPECAQAQIPGYTGRKWDKMIHEFLEPQYGVSAIPGSIANGGGAFVPDDIGNIGNLYDKVMLNNSFEALPTTYK